MDPTPPPPNSFDAVLALKSLWAAVVTFTMFWFVKYVGKVDSLEKNAVTREELDKYLKEMRTHSDQLFRDMREERRTMHEENRTLMERGSNKMDRIDHRVQRLAIQVARGNRGEDESEAE